MGSDGDILVSHSPPVFNHSPATFYNSYGNCRFQNTNNVQRQRLKSSIRANSSRSTCTSSSERKPRPCLVVRPDDNSSSSSSSSDENEPQSPIRQKKKVVFADDRGFSLTQIRLMVENPLEKVPAVALANLKLDEPAKPANIWKILFSQPASNYLDFRKRLEDENVSLENVIVKCNENELTGTVKVKNICFEKSVIIRATTNNWINHDDTDCSFVDNNTSAAVTIIYDTFSFKLKLPEDKDSLQFCVRFKSAQGEFWDNCDGKNYSVVKNNEQNPQTDVKTVRNVITTGISPPGPVRANSWPSYGQWNSVNSASVGYQGSLYW